MSGPPATPVLILEDDAEVRASLARAVTADATFRVAGAAATLAEGRRLLDREAPALALFDLRLADGHALELVPAAVERGVTVLVITSAEDDASVFEALASGARGYVLKSDPDTSIAAALRAAREGGSPISPRIAARLLDRFGPVSGEARPTLTAREREVAELFATGATYAETGRALGISVNTVRSHVRELYEKLHVASKAELVSKLSRR